MATVTTKMIIFRRDLQFRKVLLPPHKGSSALRAAHSLAATSFPGLPFNRSESSFSGRQYPDCGSALRCSGSPHSLENGIQFRHPRQVALMNSQAASNLRFACQARVDSNGNCHGLPTYARAFMNAVLSFELLFHEICQPCDPLRQLTDHGLCFCLHLLSSPVQSLCSPSSLIGRRPSSALSMDLPASPQKLLQRARRSDRRLHPQPLHRATQLATLAGWRISASARLQLLGVRHQPLLRLVYVSSASYRLSCS